MIQGEKMVNSREAAQSSRLLFARSSPAVGLALCGQLAEVIASPFRGNAPAFLAEYRGCWQLGLLEQIVRKGKGCAEQFPASCCPVLWQGWSCGENAVCFGYQFLECSEFVSSGHEARLRQEWRKSNRSLFRQQHAIKTLPPVSVKVHTIFC
jgi:hypothetical protein